MTHWTTTKFFIRYLDHRLMEKFRQELDDDELFYSLPVEQKYGFKNGLDTSVSSKDPSLKRNILKAFEKAHPGKSVKIEVKNFLYSHCNGKKPPNKFLKLAFDYRITRKKLTPFAIYLETKPEELLKEFQSHLHDLHFRCGVYDLETHNPLLFDLTIKSYSKQSLVDEYLVEMVGIHQDSSGRDILKGTAVVKGSHLFIALHGTDDSNQHVSYHLKMSVDPQKLSRMQVMLGVFSGISRRDHPTCGEVVFIKKDDELIRKAGDEKLMMQYLMLSHKHIITKRELLDTISAAYANGHPPRRLIELFSNTVHYVLNFDGDRNLIISSFKVDDCFRGFFQTIYAPPENEQVCRLVLTSPFNKPRLHISTYKGGENHLRFGFDDIIGNVFVDIPSEDRKVDYMTGVSCTAGYSQSNAGHIVLVKANSDVVPKKVKRNMINDYLTRHAYLSKGYEELDKLSS